MPAPSAPVQAREGFNAHGNGAPVQVPPPSAAEPPRPPLLVDSREAARLLGVSERTLWGLTDAGELPAIYLGRAKRYAVGELEAFIQRRLDGQREGGQAARQSGQTAHAPAQ